MKDVGPTKSCVLGLLTLIFLVQFCQPIYEMNPGSVPITSDIAIQTDRCLAGKQIDVCTSTPDVKHITSCVNNAVGESEYIDTTEINNVMTTFYASRGGVPVYHETLIDEISSRLSSYSDIINVMSTELGSILGNILGQEVYSQENPFVALCYLKRVGSVVIQLLTDVTECYTLMNSLNDNFASLSTEEISTALLGISQSKKTIESHVSAYKDSVKKNQLGNLDFLIEHAIKYRMGDDKIFTRAAEFTLRLMYDEQTTPDPISRFLGKFGIIPATEDSHVIVEQPEVVFGPMTFDQSTVGVQPVIVDQAEAVDKPLTVDEQVIPVKAVLSNESRINSQGERLGDIEMLSRKENKKNNHAIIYSAVALSIVVFVAVSIVVTRIILRKRRSSSESPGLLRSYAERRFLEQEFE